MEIDFGGPHNAADFSRSTPTRTPLLDFRTVPYSADPDGYCERKVWGNSLYGDLYVKLSVGTTRGEPAHWARSIAPRPCIRLDPCWTRTMKQSFASTARLRAAGPFCRRHRSHGVVRVTATSARH